MNGSIEHKQRPQRHTEEEPVAWSNLREEVRRRLHQTLDDSETWNTSYYTCTCTCRTIVVVDELHTPSIHCIVV